MSKYTITIKELMKNGFDFKLELYPIFNEEYREILNTKILNHYFMDEIGFETPALFRHYLLTKLNEIMPYYNILYTEQEKILDKLTHNIDLTDSTEKNTNTDTSITSNSESNSDNTTNSDKKNLYQDTPQGNLSKIDFDSQTYATNLTLEKDEVNSKINDNTNSTSTSNITNIDNIIKKVTGNTGGKYNIELIKEIKNNILNIDMMIIDELYFLFMGVF